MASVYRKTQGQDTWHFCRNCSHWPIYDYIERPELPSNAELCNECDQKQREGNCR
jgi:hypothetical protein